KELRAMLSPLGVQLSSQAELGIADADEPWPGFVENALAKARHGARASGLPTLADDSGLCVPALGGAPGVRSARYALDVITDATERERLAGGGRALLDPANIAQLLVQTRALPQPVRAYFYSVVVWVASPDDPRPLIAEGLWWGTLLPAPRGEGGFGYDPIFKPDEFEVSAAELTPEQKNAFSHRRRALTRFQTLLAEAGYDMGVGV
ncbi:MAG: non-canonical purine NTP pyrophosphatase, partial [Lautropia sp.]|nr:non-canonical purine NTP pyrophosphatase [Lautropia sp.]